MIPVPKVEIRRVLKSKRARERKSRTLGDLGEMT